jgi:hypothetical protein
MSPPRRGMLRVAVRGRARAAHQRTHSPTHARKDLELASLVLTQLQVWYLRSCSTGEVRSLQPMPVPRDVRTATYSHCPNHQES